tara:strand:+ start:1064 stop:2902 length:1839 start_codon:yes stop_codon:yes gene_type:complete
MEILANAFRDYRAEWQQEQFGRFFVEPPYLSSLAALRPTFLEGGRGTGKTVALQSMKYSELFARKSELAPLQLPYFAVYIRISQLRVRAFDSPAFDEEASKSLFADYLNMLIVHELCDLAEWLIAKGSKEITTDSLRHVCMFFDFEDVKSVKELRDKIKDRMLNLQMYINNPGAKQRPILSPPEQPVMTFSKVISNSIKDKTPVFICLDEYENLSIEQQRIVNTYIKHAESPLSYKIGIKKYGRLTRGTLGDELLESPADYHNIDVSSFEEYSTFAQRVIQARLEYAVDEGVNVPKRIEELLPSLSFEDEATLLGVGRVIQEFEKELDELEAMSELEEYRQLSITEKHIIAYWNEKKQERPDSTVRDFLSAPSKWRDRVTNYSYESLFWLSRGRKGARIRKYYSGWSTFFNLSSGNIRYLLELIDRSITKASQSPAKNKTFAVEPRIQTEAARRVGRERLEQLEALTEHGVEIKRVVLAIGKVFFELARSPLEGAPETNSFVLQGQAEEIGQVVELLTLGVSHLAFEVSPRTKATTIEEPRDGEYRLHPIFCPFFEYSYRKKRRVTFNASDFLLLGEDPKNAISNMLKRKSTVENEMPEQLSLYETFFNGQK